MPPAALILMYFMAPIWLLAGITDWACHRATNIQGTTGAKESAIHLLMFSEVGLPLLLVLFFDVNALILAVAIAAFFIHEATVGWDLSYATPARYIGPFEQMVHSFLEILPMMAIGLLIVLHWDQFLALFGAGSEPVRFELAWKRPPLPAAYIVGVIAAAVVFGVIPYLEELWRCLKARGMHPVLGRAAAE